MNTYRLKKMCFEPVTIVDNSFIFMFESYKINDFNHYNNDGFSFDSMSNEEKHFWTVDFVQNAVMIGVAADEMDITINQNQITVIVDITIFDLEDTKENISAMIDKWTTIYKKNGWNVRTLVDNVFQPWGIAEGSKTFCCIFRDFCVIGSKDIQKAAYADNGLYDFEIIHKDEGHNYSWYFAPRYDVISHQDFQLLSYAIGYNEIESFNEQLSIPFLRQTVLCNSKCDHPFWQMFLHQLDVLELAGVTNTDITWDLRPCNVLRDRQGNYLPYDIIYI